jgi:ADP-ribosylglycohydrolase
LEVVAGLNGWSQFNWPSLIEKARESALSQKTDSEALKEYGLACSLANSLPGTLHILYRYHSDPIKGLIKSAIAGGDTCARNITLGMVYGAFYPDTQWPKSWTEDLKFGPELSQILGSY